MEKKGDPQNKKGEGKGEGESVNCSAGAFSQSIILADGPWTQSGYSNVVPEELLGVFVHSSIVKVAWSILLTLDTQMTQAYELASHSQCIITIPEILYTYIFFSKVHLSYVTFIS